MSFSNFILDHGGVAGAARQRLARAADLPEWVLASGDTMVPSAHQLRLWELVEYQVGDPDVALRIGRINTMSRFGIHDYLFGTAPTLGGGLALSEHYADLITTNIGFAIAGESEDVANADVRLLNGHGRGQQLAMQFALAAVVTRARNATGRDIHPVRVRFRQSAPRRRSGFVELFGTRRIDFGAPTDQITFRTADLALPMRNADPVLAEILRRYAAAQPPPRRLEITWTGQVHQVLLTLLGDGRVTIDRAARYMATSTRSLQRRLADEGTTWTRELDRARSALVEQRIHRGRHESRDSLAEQVGYSDSGALRRARRRWST
ncbi:AraC family transcriptional regulator [Nocardia cyriacigeorgica]|uniref:AraC family transcriptional regulator n=1 Tax=Nocardia cyriacigeorgica TaxID=135487 RepID=A0A6P1D9S4_9NOCA|nr:AraC family transcriptional regulator ligand-binding domain-containing protein [Nocardia cyriacigeorgica]NEW46301.1 AraC family transcriptional regulator [Nocardia cyriacigeorgica]NEW52473.1 AraC family transcriptional regulator [Nocardia cyriacigeorgica]